MLQSCLGKEILTMFFSHFFVAPPSLEINMKDLYIYFRYRKFYKPYHKNILCLSHLVHSIQQWCLGRSRESGGFKQPRLGQARINILNRQVLARQKLGNTQRAEIICG